MTEPAEPTTIPTQDPTPAPQAPAPAPAPEPPAEPAAAPDQTEALAAEANDDRLPVPLCNNVLHVPPMSTWRQSAMRALRTGDFETWAEKILSPEDFATFCYLDPTNAEVDAFFQAAAAKMGLGLGNSSASRRS